MMAASEGVRTTHPEEPDDAERVAVLEGQIQDLRDMLAKMRHSRNQWLVHAARLSQELAAPRRPWWRRLAG